MSKAIYGVTDGGVTLKHNKMYRVVDGNITQKIRKAYVVAGNFPLRGLPEGYTQVKCIIGTGTQYIDALFQPNQDTAVHMDVQLTQTPGSVTAAYFGARKMTAGVYFALMKANPSSTKLYWEYGSDYVEGWAVDYTARRTLTTDGPSATVDGATQTLNSATFELGLNLYLLATNDDGVANAIVAGTIYPSQIYSSAGVLARDFVPCINPDGEVGLYDMVDGAFHGNAGTGVFTAGDTFKYVTRLSFEAETSVQYTGNYERSIVQVDGENRVLYTLTSSGTLTVDDTVDFWMCGSGGNGYTIKTNNDVNGGPGGDFATGNLASGKWTVSIGAGGYSKKSTINNETTTFTTDPNSGGTKGSSGGCGGVHRSGIDEGYIYSYGRQSTYPFGLTALKEHCAGGGGGAGYLINTDGNKYVRDGNYGGSNGMGGGLLLSRVSGKTTATGGNGGTYGGGKGGDVTSATTGTNGASATFYGSGGGGAPGAYNYSTSVATELASPGSGYQGVVYLLLPA